MGRLKKTGLPGGHEDLFVSEQKQNDEQDLTDAQLLTRALLREHRGARDSLVEFYNRVMRHELTKEHLIAAPHQVLMFSFMEYHNRAVLRMPVGTGKTFGTAAASLWLMGRDITQRGAIISKTRAQAQKPLAMVADYITEDALNGPLILIFPWLKKSSRPNDPWTQHQLTIDRDPGIRDPSLIAVGYDGAIAGARLSWLVGDDIIDDENTNTPNIREGVKSKFDGRLMSRLDPMGSRAIVTNTPWHREDLTYHLENDVGWPTLTMDIYGFIRVTNADAAWLRHALDNYLRISTTRTNQNYDWYRLAAHDPDEAEEIPLWPERYSSETIERIKKGLLPHEFARLYLCQPLSEDASRCKRSWVEACKYLGMGKTLKSEYSGSNPTFTGLDLGIGSSARHDKTVFFTFELMPDDKRRLLDIDAGNFSGPEIIDKIDQKTRAYNSVLSVESNQGQDYIRQFAEEKNLLVRAHTTTRANKQHIDFGVEAVFTEIKNGLWIIPCDKDGRCASEVQAWIDEMIYYQPPPAHTGDRLMASWIAREHARKNRRHDPAPSVGRKRELVNAGQF